MSEFGFQSFPEFSSVDKYTNESDYSIYSEVMKSHQRSSIGNSTVEDYMLRYYNKPNSFKGYLYVSQILQAYGVSMGMEAHRRNKGYSMGSLYWQLNDCWPVASWSSIDYFGKWKALHYSTKKAFQPVLISFFKSDSEIELHIISDLLESKDVDLNLKVLSFSGEVLYEINKKYLLQQNSTIKAESLSIEWLNKNFDPNSSLLVASLFSNEIELFIPPKKGKSHVLRIIRELIEFQPKSTKTSVNNALKFLSSVMKKKAIVFVLSDFMDEHYEHTLKIVGRKHDVTGIRVYDKHDVEMPNVGMVPMVDAETGETLLVDTTSKSVRNGYAAHYLKSVDYFEKSFNHSGAGTISSRIDESYVKKLLGYFKQKGAR